MISARCVMMVSGTILKEGREKRGKEGIQISLGKLNLYSEYTYPSKMGHVDVLFDRMCETPGDRGARLPLASLIRTY